MRAPRLCVRSSVALCTAPVVPALGSVVRQGTGITAWQETRGGTAAHYIGLSHASDACARQCLAKCTWRLCCVCIRASSCLQAWKIRCAGRIHGASVGCAMKVLARVQASVEQAVALRKACDTGRYLVCALPRGWRCRCRRSMRRRIRQPLPEVRDAGWAASPCYEHARVAARATGVGGACSSACCGVAGPGMGHGLC